MSIQVLKEEDFFKKRSAILEKAKSYGFETLWVILPKGGTGLYEDKLHIMYTLSDPWNTPLENEFLFLQALDKELPKCDNRLATEESLVSLTGKFMARARLESVVPIEQLAEDVELEEQTPTPLPIPSDDALQKRIQETAEHFRSREIATSEIGDLKVASPLTALISPSSPIFSQASLEGNNNRTEEKRSTSPKRKSSQLELEEAIPKKKSTLIPEVKDLLFALIDILNKHSDQPEQWELVEEQIQQNKPFF